MIDPQLAGRVALVTGANNPEGIGAATARALAAQGAAVCLHFFRRRGDSRRGADPDSESASAAAVDQEAPSTPPLGEARYWSLQQRSAEAIVAELRSSGARATCIEGDLRDAATIPALFDHAAAELGPVEILVNNAAASDADTFVPPTTESERSAVDGFGMDTIDAASIDHVFGVNARAAALLIAEMARRHVARGADWGRIVNVSTDGASGFQTQVSYGASKHALESYGRAAAGELGRYGITANIVSLGPIQTGWIGPEIEADLSRSTPLGRVGQPDDAADVITFLCSDQARWLTGQLIYVGGGHLMPL